MLKNITYKIRKIVYNNNIMLIILRIAWSDHRNKQKKPEEKYLLA